MVKKRARRKNPGDYEVVVGNIGTVYSGGSKTQAAVKYASYVKQSKKGVGRAGGEDVAMFKDGDIVREHGGTRENPRLPRGKWINAKIRVTRNGTIQAKIKR